MIDEDTVRVDDLRVIVPGSHTIVDGVSFGLRAGEVLGLVGESGSGKTSVALALLGFARTGMELRGSARVCGIDVVSSSPSALQDIRGRVVSYVPQDPSASLNPGLRIGFQLRERLRAHDRAALDDPSRIRDVLERMQLPSSGEFLRRYPNQLSGGQIQRVCIALAVLCRPQVLVLDEPTTGLDVMTQARVLELVRRLNAEDGSTAVYVTHDLAVVAGLADRLAVMYAGLFVEEGPTETILGSPVHPYTRRLVQSTPSLGTRKSLVGIGGSPLNPRDRVDACPFLPRCDFATPICSDRLPVLEVVAAEHLVRCARASEFARDTVTAHSAGLNGLWSERSHDEGQPVLEVRALSARYGAHEVLHEVMLSVQEGECVAVVGESGSGKTTLARCISGLHSGTATGTLRYAGAEISLHPRGRSQDVRRDIQYVFQSPYAALNPRVPVGRSIALPLEVFGLGDSDRRATVRDLLARVALDPAYESRYPSQLSGGERQRVAIARALAAQPRVLVCDEVTSALDVSIQASILELLGVLRRDLNLTILFITHHLALVRTVADRAVVMRDGLVVEQGFAGAMLDEPQDAYTRELITATPVLGSREGSL